MPSQCSMASTVVAFRVAPLSPCSTGRTGLAWTPRRAPFARDQVSSVLGTVGVMHLKADDLAAVEVQDQVEVEPASLVAPAGTSRPSTRPRQARWQCVWSVGAMSAAVEPAPGLHLTTPARAARHGSWTHWRSPDTLVGQCKDNPRRWRLGEARFIGDLDDPGPFGLAQSVRRDTGRSVGIGFAGNTPAAGFITGLPASAACGHSMPARAQVGAGRAPSAPGLFDVAHQDLAVFQAGHASSPSWKTARVPDSTSKAAVSASVLAMGSTFNSLTRSRSAELPQHWPPAARRGRRSRSSFQASSRADTALARALKPLRVASSIAAVTITSAAAPCCPARAAGGGSIGQGIRPRQRSSVATLIPTSRDASRSPGTLRRQQPRHDPIFGTLVRIEPLSAIRAPKGSDPI